MVNHVMIDPSFVSVILPTYNRPNYAVAALKDLFNQDYPVNKYEILIVDNGDTDITERLIRKHCSINTPPVPVKYIKESRQGLVYGRHTGAAYANGNILVYGDDDARYESNWISAIIQVYNDNPEIGAVGTKILIEWDQQPEAWVIEHEGVLGKLVYSTEVLVKTGLQIYGGSFSIRKNILLAMQGFNPGQVDRFILGDSETGLCNKLAVANIPVGWTPYTTVWHQQIAAKNGTLQDIKRRYWNNGICSAYHDCFTAELNVKKKVRTILKNTCRNIYAYLFSTIKCRQAQRVLNYTFSIAYVYYILRYHLDLPLRKKILSTEWKYTEKYNVPPLSFQI